MKMYLIALGAGLLAGVVYGLLNVRSPAPPVVALVGLLGILIGEQAVPLAKRLVAGHAAPPAPPLHAPRAHAGTVTGRPPRLGSAPPGPASPHDG